MFDRLLRDEIPRRFSPYFATWFLLFRCAICLP